MAYGLAADLAEAHSHRLAGRLHNALGAGEGVPEVLAEVRRRLAVGPEHDEAGGRGRRGCAGGSKAPMVTPVPIGEPAPVPASVPGNLDAGGIRKDR